MKIWQGLMIRLATSPRLKAIMQSSRATSRLAGRFVGGRDIEDALTTVAALRDQGFTVSGYYLGEYVDRRDLVDLNVREIGFGVGSLAASGFQLHFSIDPTQIGYGFDDPLGAANAQAIGDQIRALADARGRAVLMLDMEDHTFVDRTLALRRRLAEAGVPVAQTLQAYLRRTEADLEGLIAEGAMVRLVKGAFVGSPDIAFTGRAEIDASYRRLTALMLSGEARDRGCYPVFGTHDEAMIAEVEARVAAGGWDADTYEFEMLHGVRPELQRELVRRGHRVRVYLPYGADWWPYAVRRVGESPRNARLLMRALLTGR